MIEFVGKLLTIKIRQPEKQLNRVNRSAHNKGNITRNELDENQNFKPTSQYPAYFSLIFIYLQKTL